MSLTSLLANKDVRKKFAEEFPMPKLSLQGDILAPSRTKHHKAVGIAFDYLMRFYLQRLNPKAIIRPWVAEQALEEVKDNKVLLRKVTKTITEAKKAYSHYLKSGRMGRDILKSAMLVAPLDLISRAGFIDENIGTVDNEDVKDLRKLFSIVDSKPFKAKSLCILNPTFGDASSLVGGADADILIDNTLIEIKTVKNWKLQRYHFNQIIGYYILSRIGGINGAPSKHKIDTLGIYYSRYGELYTFPVKALINERRLLAFIKWFDKRAIQEEEGFLFSAKVLSSLIDLTGRIDLIGEKKVEDLPPFINFTNEKEVEGVLVDVWRVKRHNFVFYIVEREGRRECFLHNKQVALQIAIGSEIKICFSEKSPKIYWRPRGLNDRNQKVAKHLEMLKKELEKELKTKEKVLKSLSSSLADQKV